MPAHPYLLPALIVLFAAAAAADAAEGASLDKHATPEPGILADSSYVAHHEELTDADRERVRSLAVFVAEPRGMAYLRKALDHLAQQDERFALRQRTYPSGYWLEDGGHGHRPVGSRRDAADRFADVHEELAELQHEGRVDFLALPMDEDDIDMRRRFPTTRVRVSRPMAGLDVRAENVTNLGSRQANITSPAGPGNTTLNFPIELPTTGYSKVHTRVRVPVGSAASSSVGPRHPLKVFKAYNSAMATLGRQEDLQVVAMTARADADDQAVAAFNQRVREAVASDGWPVLDMDELANHSDEDEAKRRVALGWWYLLADLSAPPTLGSDYPER